MSIVFQDILHRRHSEMPHDLALRHHVLVLQRVFQELQAAKERQVPPQVPPRTVGQRGDQAG